MIGARGDRNKCDRPSSIRNAFHAVLKDTIEVGKTIQLTKYLVARFVEVFTPSAGVERGSDNARIGGKCRCPTFAVRSAGCAIVVRAGECRRTVLQGRSDSDGQTLQVGECNQVGLRRGDRQTIDANPRSVVLISIDGVDRRYPRAVGQPRFETRRRAQSVRCRFALTYLVSRGGARVAACFGPCRQFAVARCARNEGLPTARQCIGDRTVRACMHTHKRIIAGASGAAAERTDSAAEERRDAGIAGCRPVIALRGWRERVGNQAGLRAAEHDRSVVRVGSRDSRWRNEGLIVDQRRERSERQTVWAYPWAGKRRQCRLTAVVGFLAGKAMQSTVRIVIAVRKKRHIIRGIRQVRSRRFGAADRVACGKAAIAARLGPGTQIAGIKFSGDERITGRRWRYGSRGGLQKRQQKRLNHSRSPGCIG